MPIQSDCLFHIDTAEIAIFCRSNGSATSGPRLRWTRPSRRRVRCNPGTPARACRSQRPRRACRRRPPRGGASRRWPLWTATRAGKEKMVDLESSESGRGLILANRWSDELADDANKAYTKDLGKRNWGRELPALGKLVHSKFNLLEHGVVSTPPAFFKPLSATF